MQRTEQRQPTTAASRCARRWRWSRSSSAITAVVADEAALGLAAAVVGVAAAGVGALVDVRRTRAEDSLWEARSQARRLRRQLESLQVAVAEEQTSGRRTRPAPAELPDRHRHRRLGDRPGVGAAPRTSPPRAAAAGRGGRPPQGAAGVGRVLGARRPAAAPLEAREQALTALGAVAWRTLRESDSVFRLGDVVAVAVLVDTAEPGALMVADRVREALRASPVGDSLTVSAGIACYPTPRARRRRARRRAPVVRSSWHAAPGHERDHVAIAEQLPA